MEEIIGTLLAFAILSVVFVTPGVILGNWISKKLKKMKASK